MEGATMYRKILVPLDGSQRAERVLPHVRSMAEKYHANVIFLKVDEEPVKLGVDEVIDEKTYHAAFEQQKAQTRGYLDARVEDFIKGGVNASSRIAYGPVVKTVVHTADAVDADLVALASHGLSATARVSYGSVAAGLLQHLTRPVLIICTVTYSDEA